MQNNTVTECFDSWNIKETEKSWIIQVDFPKEKYRFGIQEIISTALIIKVLQVKLRERIKIYTDTHTQNLAKSKLLGNDLI